MSESTERRYKMHKDFVPPVSIEEFAAYLDENLSEEEMNKITSVINIEDNLQTIMSNCYTIDNAMASYERFEQIIPKDILSDNFEIPDFNNDIENGDIMSISEDSIYIEAIDSQHIVVNDKFSNDNLNANTMASTIRINSSNYGETRQNIKDPIFIQQPDDHSCALRSQQIILRDFGIDIPFNDLEKIALDSGVYTNEGTYTYDIGKVLELAGVGMHQVTDTSLDDLMNELSQGHRVIVSVDADELWYNDNLNGRLSNWFNDVIGHQGGNHALIVAGVEVNPNDVNDIKVVLTDPGTGHLRIEYPANQFINAWKDSDCFMAATDNPAPFQYDASTGMEVPSNFAIKQYLNQFITENSYQLSPDLINIPTGYQPAFDERIEMVGNIGYNSLNEELGRTNITNTENLAEDGDELFSHNNTATSLDVSSPFIDDNGSEYKEVTQKDNIFEDDKDDDNGDFEDYSDSF